MQFTSSQILAKKFRRKLVGGYHDVEVDIYLDSLAQYVDALSKENAALQEEVKALKDKQEQVARLEDTLRDALVTAQRSGEELTKNAQQKADLIVSSAQDEADRILAQAQQEAEAIRDQFAMMQRRNQDYRNAFLSLVSQQMELFELDDSLQQEAEN